MTGFRIRNLSEASQTALITAVCVGLPLLLLTAASATLLKQDAVGHATTLLEVELDLLVDRIDALNAAHLREARALTLMPRISEYCMGDAVVRESGQARVRDVLGAIVGSGDGILAAAVADVGGRVLVSTLISSEGVDAARRGYFRNAALGDESISDLFRVRQVVGDMLAVAYAVPVRDPQGAVRCVVTVAARADSFGAVLRSRDDFGGEGSFVVLVDQFGLRTGHSEREEYMLRPTGPIPAADVAMMVEEGRFNDETASLLGNPIVDERVYAFATAKELPVEPVPFWGEAPATGQMTLSIARRLRTAPWTLVARIPEDQVTAGATQVVRIEAVLGLTSMLCAVALSIWLTRPRVRRINAMAAAADALAGGQTDVRIPDGATDELGRVTSRFNAMAEAIGEQVATLETTVAQRTTALTAANLELEAQKEELQAQKEELLAQKEELLAQKEQLHVQTDRLIAQTGELELRNAVVERADRLKSEFLSNMSHELRTPLNAVIGFSDLLEHDEEEPLSPRQRGFVEAVSQAGRHQLALINDILDLSKIEAGHMRLDQESVNVDAALLAAKQAVEPAAKRKHITVSTGSGALARADADPRRLHQILLNLLSNAVKFSPDSSEVELRAADSNGFVTFEVADRGPGLTEDMWPRLFSPFQQADSPLVKRHEGTGLGLAISRRLVELHGGEISARPREGGGLIVRFSVPVSQVAVAPHPDVPNHPDTHTADIARRLSPLSVLVIDDDPTVGRILYEILRDAGMAVRSVTNAEDGLAQIAMSVPQVCIIDLHMPGTSGFTALARLRENEPNTTIAVVVFTGADLSNDDVARLRDHAAVIVRKGDVSPRELVAGIGQAIRLVKPPPLGAVTRALVIDDHDMNRALLRAVLENAGFEVLEASDALAGLASARAERPGIILMDLAMPGMDGLEATRQLKANPATAGIPVVALTALAMRRDEAAAIAAGADAYVTKPFDGPTLLALIRTLVTGA